MYMCVCLSVNMFADCDEEFEGDRRRRGSRTELMVS